MSATDRIADALRAHGCDPRQSGPSWKARCPAHDDSDPSLSFRQGDQSALLRCWGGCQTVDVLAALGLSMADLYDNPGGAEYRYGDGRIVHRTPDKRFRQSGNTTGRPQLYRLPEVVAAVQDGRPVYLVEGEKDADAVRLLGATATTAPMGAANFRKVDAAPLTGAHVVVVPDRDAPGESWLADVVAELTGKAASLRLAHVVAGKDAADHIAAGHGLDDLIESPIPKMPPTAGRRLVLTCADTIDPQPVYWVWHQRMPTGCLALLAGREQVGKSTYAYHLAARITRGQLPGEHYGSPRAVLICATEDSWAHTIVPRLIAAGADLGRVFRVEVMSADDIHVGPTLPLDVPAIEGAARQTGAALLLLDPLMSRLAAELDPHKDAEVRQALEPIAAVADRTGLLVLGLIHFNKTASTDVLNLVMGSRAFAAVARSVSVVVPDPDDETGRRRLFSTPKSNLGRADLPSLAFTVENYAVPTATRPSDVGHIVEHGESHTSAKEAMERAGEDVEVRTAIADAVEWLRDYLAEHDSGRDSAEIKRAAGKAGHSERTVGRARTRLGILSVSVPGAAPRRTTWALPEPNGQASRASRAKPPRGDGITGMTDITTGQGVLGSDLGTTSRASCASHDRPPREVGTTVTDTVTTTTDGWCNAHAWRPNDPFVCGVESCPTHDVGGAA